MTVVQRLEAVLALLCPKQPAAHLARRYWVSEETLYRWRDDYLVVREVALAKGKNGSDVRQHEMCALKSEV